MLQLAASLLTGSLAAQATDPEPAFEGGGTRFGRAVLSMADLDEDGVRDLAVGAPTAQDQSGRVLVLSGATQEVLQVWVGEAGRRTFGHSLRAAGDVDGDDRDDVLVGYESGARTEVRSGQSGLLLAAFDRASDEVHPFGDLDGDGRAELLLENGRRWEIRAGVGGGFVAGPTYALEVGSFHSIGDLNGDGLADGLVLGERALISRTTRERHFETRWHNPMPYELQTPLPEVWGGALAPLDGLIWRRALPAGDVDADGRADVVLTVRSPGAAPAERRGEVSVLVLSPAKPDAPIWSAGFPAPYGDEECFGYALAAPGDLDGDGRADLVFAEEIQPFATVMSAYSLAKGERLWQRSTGAFHSLSGLSLSAFEDRDDDGAVDVLVGSSDWYWHGLVFVDGSVTLVSGRTGETIWSVDEERYHAVLHASEKPK
jgi:hypothetical protein